MKNKFTISSEFIEKQKVKINIFSLFILVTVLSHCNGAQEGDIQLMGGATTQFEGNVFIYHLNTWGMICDDAWGMDDAEVTCRQLGFGGALKATKYNHYRTHKRRIWKDNVKCSGVESKLVSCASNPWAIHNCNYREAAGVKCSPPENSVIAEVVNETTIKPTNRPTEKPTDRPTEKPTDRPIEKPTDKSTEKPTDRPTEKPATTQSSPTTTTTPTNDSNNVPLALYLEALGKSAVKKVFIQQPKEYEIRLLGGRYSTEGRLEVYHNGKWGVICGEHWGLFEAMVACKQLGLGYGKNALQADFFGGSHLPKHFARIDCNGNEKSLHECTHSDIVNGKNCERSELVSGIICSKTLPDLVPDLDLLAKSVRLEDKPLHYLQCAKEENCLSDSASSDTYSQYHTSRRLLRFSSSAHNNGTADFLSFIPPQAWEWHSCHLHYHSMDVFAHYDILDERGNKVAQGHKASFCLEDTDCSPGVKPKYQCSRRDQGISVGCADTYKHDIDCQWIDITDIKPGIYVFKVNINPEFKVAELSFDNNAISCELRYTAVSATLRECRLGRG